MASGSNKANWVFAVLAGYVILQFLWWAYLLLSLNTDYYHLKQELYLAWGVNGDADPLTELSNRKRMVLGEGIIFLILLLVGIVLTARYMRRDIQVARQQRNFLLSVTHELKTPIAATKLYLQTLQKRQLEPEKQSELIGRALSGNQRLEKLVEKIILATQLENSKFALNIERLDLKPVLTDALETMRSIDEGNHHFELSCPEDLFIRGDTMAIETIVLNLIENAIKYSPEGSLIQIRADKQSEALVLQVENDGEIPADDQKLIFQKFFRGGNEETRTAKGTGVGLFLVRELAELHEGAVEVRSEQGKVIFTLKIPD